MLRGGLCRSKRELAGESGESAMRRRRGREEWERARGWPAGCGYWSGLKGQLDGARGVRRHNNKRRSLAAP